MNSKLHFKKHQTRTPLRMKGSMHFQLLGISILCLIQCSVQEATAGPYQSAAVTTDVGQCSTMGKDILKSGGSAVDAAITSVLCVGVVNPQSSGIGGGLSMVVYSNDTQEAEALIALEKAPLDATPEMFKSRSASRYGAKSIAVPGEVQGLWDAHQRYGKLPWADLFDPVIEMAEKGFQVTSHLPYVLGKLSDSSSSQFIKNKYSGETGTALETGDIIKAPKLAATLRKIAVNGSGEFYNGTIANDMIDDMRKQKGIITQDDFSAFDTEWRPVTKTTFKNDLTMYSAPLPTSGPVLQYILNVLDEYDITSNDFSNFEKKTLLYHRFLEAGKFAFALRSHLGDDPESTTVENILMALGSKDFAKYTKSSINDAKVMNETRKAYDISGDILEEAETELDEEEGMGDTSHVSVLAENGDAVSVTTSIGYYFGSKFYSEKTGVFLNNHMANFYFPKREEATTRIWSWPTANGIAPGRRYMTTTCPNVLVDDEGSVKMVVGASGGSRIISTNAWVILRTLWMGANLKEAVDEKRICNFLPSSNVAYREPWFSKTVRENLIDMGHKVKKSSNFAVSQTILRNQEGELDAYSDARKGGLADGY